MPPATATTAPKIRNHVRVDEYRESPANLILQNPEDAGKPVPHVDPAQFKAALDEVYRQYGDSAVIGEPFADKNGRAFGEVYRNGRLLDTVYLGPPIQQNGRELARVVVLKATADPTTTTPTTPPATTTMGVPVPATVTAPSVPVTPPPTITTSNTVSEKPPQPKKK